MSKTIRIGTRKSKLAMVQTTMVRDQLKEAYPDVDFEIVKIDTKGDKILDQSLTSFGGKGVFTAELEAQLLSGDIDIAVHSAKDMPMEFPEGLGIGAACKRADMRDIFVTTDGRKLEDLPKGSIVGTSSLRRELQIKEINPTVTIKLLRGNVQTRLRKLMEGQYDGIILAAAGVERLGLEKEEGFYYQYMDPKVFLPAAGQGIMAVESRLQDSETAKMLAAIDDYDGRVALTAERAFLKTIGGSCNAPAAGYFEQKGDRLEMRAKFAKDGENMQMAVKSLDLDGRDRVEAARELGIAIAREVNQGKVYLIGGGPGDEDLITRKALGILRTADVVVYDSLASDSLLNEVKDDCELVYAGKRSSHHYLKQYETNELLIKLAKDGKIVARLKGGDPYIFGRGGEEGQELREAGVDFEVIPGISSSYSVPSYCGIPVTHRDYASSFHVITGHEGSHKHGKYVLDYATLAKEEGTLIFLMGLANLPNIVRELMANGKDPETPVGVLQEGTTAKQKVATGTLETIVDVVKKEGIRTPAITVVGNVVSLHDVLNWYGGKPLSGKRVLVTGTKSMSEKLSPILKKEGAEAISFSLVRTEKLDSKELHQAILNASDYQWIVFTSANGVDIFFDKLSEMRRDIRTFASVKFAVIGEGTRKALENHGVYCDFMPKAFSSKDMAEALIPAVKEGEKVLLLRAKEANAVLPEALEKAGIAHKCISLYHTVYDDRKADELNRIVPSCDYITFASSSAIKAYHSMLEDTTEVHGKYISIGPVTSKTAAKLGYTIGAQAVSYTAQGMVDVMIQDAAKEK
ncbi:MAG: hydroxymethylbilane synthase [Lachnospiraceae bacterium]|nr:hydroxymethylbilane synthase [Lachnospiraceae bacterium]